jgi:hypothetical protein
MHRGFYIHKISEGYVMHPSLQVSPLFIAVKHEQLIIGLTVEDVKASIDETYR